MSYLPPAFVANTLELVQARGPLPWKPGRVYNNKAAPLTNAHRDALRQLAREGKVQIDLDADDGIGKVWAVGGLTPEERTIKRLMAAPSGCIFIVPSGELKALCLRHLREHRPRADVYVVALIPESERVDLAPGPNQGRRRYRDILASMQMFMRFRRPLVFDASYELSAAASLEILEHNLYMRGEQLPDADEVYAGDPDL
jgi:hypothetical protein